MKDPDNQQDEGPEEHSPEFVFGDDEVKIFDTRIDDER